MRTRPLACVITVLVLATACASTPDTAPDVGGTVAPAPGAEPAVSGTVSRAPGADPVLVDASVAYYEGMALLTQGTAVLRGDETVDGDDLADGERVDVWIGDICAESFPVQCEVATVRVP